MNLVTSTLDSVIVVWHVAVNAGDADTAAGACTEDVALTDLANEGTSIGVDAMRQWVSTSGVRLMPRDAYDVPGGIVVSQEVTYPGRADYDQSTAPVRVYTSFGLRDGSISSVRRFDSLDAARSHSLVAAA